MNSKSFTSAALALVFCLLAYHAGAAVVTWDPQGTVTTPNNGSWYTGSLSQSWEGSNWDTVNETGTATKVLWVEGTAALFAVHTGTGTPAFTVSMSANHTVAGVYNGSLTPNPCPVTISGAGIMTLLPNNLNVVDPTTDTADAGSVVFDVVIAGDTTAGICSQNGSGNTYLYKANTYAGGTYLGDSLSVFGAGIWNFNNNSSFGTGPIVFLNCAGGALSVAGTAAITLPNNVVNYNYYPTTTCPLTVTLNIVGNANGVTFTGNWYISGGSGGTGAPGYATTTPTGNYGVLNIGSGNAVGNLVTIAGPISGMGSFNKTGSGIMAFTAANTFSGPLTVSAGTLRLGNTYALAFGGTTVVSGANLDLNGTYGVEAAITLNGTGVSSGGSLVNSNATAPATLNGDAVASATVTANGSGISSSALPNIIFSGGGGGGAVATPLLGVTAASFTITPGSQTYTVAPTATISSGGGVNATATAVLTSGQVTGITITAPGIGFSSAPTVTFTGGTTNVTGIVSTSTGNTTSFIVTGLMITAGGSGYTSPPTWASDSGGASGNTVLSSVTLATASSIGGAGGITINGVISGASSAGLTKIGTGDVTLAGANTYSGTTTLSAGTLTLDATETPGTSGPLGVATAAESLFMNGGTLQYSGVNNYDYSGRLSALLNQAWNIDVYGRAVTFATALTSPGGTLTLSDSAGGGSLTLSALNTYTGVTTINAGTLNVNGSISGNATVNNSGILNVSGSIGGNVTLNSYPTVTVTGVIAGNATVNGGTLEGSVADSIGGNVTVASGATLKLDSSTAMSSGATLTLADSSSETVNLNFGGTQNISSLVIGGTPQPAGIYGSSTSAAPPANQLACFTSNGLLNVGGGNAFYWDQNGSDAASQSSANGGGTGNWDNTLSSDWWVSGSSDSLWSAGNVANFGGTLPGTVTVADNVTAESLTFTTPGYLLNGSSTLTLFGTAPTITVPAGVATTINCPIAGSSLVTVTSPNGSPGTLVLGGANTYIGGTTVSNGATLSVNTIADSGASAIANSDVLTLGPGGGTLSYTGAGPAATVRGVTVTGAATSFIDVPAGTLTLNGQVKDSGDSAAQMLTKTSAGTLILGGNVDNSGLTMAINQGTVVVTKSSNATTHGLGGGTTTVGTGASGNSAGLQLAGSGGYSIYHTTALTVNGVDGYFDLNGQSLTLAGMGALTISGAGPTGYGALLNSGAASVLVCTGTGLILAGNTTIGGPGSIAINNVISDGSGGYAITYAGGAGATLTLTNANTFGGGITINTGGTVSLMNSATAGGTGAITMGLNTTLNVGIVPSNADLLNTISSADSTAVINLIETPADNLQLGGVMSGFSGTINCPTTPGTTAKAQILTAAVALPSTATINLAAGGTLYLAGAVTIPGALNIYGFGNSETYGALRIETGATISGPVTLYGNTSMGNGAANTTATISGAIGDGGNHYGITFMPRPGTIVLSGPNTFSGPVTNLMNGGTGTLSVNSISDTPPSALGTGTSLVISNSTFQYTGSAPVTTTRTIYGSGTNNFELPAGGSMTVSTVRSLAASKFMFIVTNSVHAGDSGTLTLGGTVDNSYLAVAVPAGITVVCNKASNSAGDAIGQDSIVSGGTLQLGNTGFGSQIYNQVTLYVTSGVFDVNGQNDSFKGLQLAGTGLSSGGALINSAAATTSTLTLSSGITLTANTSMGGPGNITLASAIGDGGHGYTLTYVGAGILTLGGANTYSGITTINGGALVVNGSTAAGSAVTIAPGATVGGGGTISGSLTVQPGAVLAPGVAAASAGTTLTLPGVVTLGSTSVVSNRISKTAGPVLKADNVNKSSGTLALGGSLTVTLDNGGIPLASGDTFPLFSGPLAGSFSGGINLPTLPAGLQWNSSGLAAGGNGKLVVQCDGSLAVTAGANPTVCGSAILTATPSGGSGAYASYLWSPGGATTQSTTATSSGTYSVTVTDSGGCQATSSGIPVTVTLLPTVSVNSTAVCTGGSATLTATTTDSNPVTYLWSPGGATTSSITVSPAATTTYTATLTDSVTSCVNSGSGTVTVTTCGPVLEVTNITYSAGTATITGTGVVGTATWFLKANGAINTPTPWTSINSGGPVPGNSVITVADPAAGSYSQRFYYLTNQ